MAHPNEDLIRQGYEAFGKGDMDTIRKLFADDIVWHAPGRNPMSGDYRGVDDVLAFFGKTIELSGGPSASSFTTWWPMTTTAWGWCG